MHMHLVHPVCTPPALVDSIFAALDCASQEGTSRHVLARPTSTHWRTSWLWKRERKLNPLCHVPPDVVNVFAKRSLP